MDTVVAEYASVTNVDEFWTNLAAVLRDEVVIREAQAAGMRWPELDDGRLRLVSTRVLIVKTAWVRGWISPDEARLFATAEPSEALAAARPWIERTALRSLPAAAPMDRIGS